MRLHAPVHLRRPVRRRSAAVTRLARAGLAALGLAATLAQATQVVVGPVDVLPPGALHVNTLLAVPWSTLAPGSQVLIAPGRYTGPMRVDSQGSAAQPVVIRPYDPAQPPTLATSVDFQGAGHVKLMGVTVEDSPWGAVVIRRGSHHITVKGNTLRRSAMGVDISDGAGTGLRIVNNLIEDHQTHGIAIVEVNASPADRSTVAYNTVRRNGHHGLEIHGSNYVIEHNTVSDSGLSLGGTSGIHLYSRTLDNFCDDNRVRYNFSYDNHDRWDYDGNGIQVDQWCDRNEVSYNVVWGNDGAGIIIFDGADNRVFGNTLKGNGQDPKRATWQLGEIIVSSQGPGLNRSAGNQVYDNLLVPGRPDAPGIFVDYTTENRPNTLGPNFYSPRPAGSWLMQRGSRFAATAPEVDRLTGSTGNLAQTPVFVEAGQPLAHGLQLARSPAKPGQRVAGERDMLGHAPSPGASFFGAYFTAPGL